MTKHAMEQPRVRIHLFELGISKEIGKHSAGPVVNYSEFLNENKVLTER